LWARWRNVWTSLPPISRSSRTARPRPSGSRRWRPSAANWNASPGTSSNIGRTSRMNRNPVNKQYTQTNLKPESMRQLLSVGAAAFLSMSNAQAKLNPMEPIPADKEVRMGKLDNGLTYYIRHNEKPNGQASFYILHDVGAIQEADNQQGLAHFLEHMAFNGTKNLPGKQMLEYLETVGVKFGYNLNAYTTW